MHFPQCGQKESGGKSHRGCGRRKRTRVTVTLVEREEREVRTRLEVGEGLEERDREKGGENGINTGREIG